MEAYKHIVQYYETDKMGITHHSNYIRWMEEARVDFLKQIGWPFERLEACGVFSPVVDIHCKYIASTTFSDEIFITVKIQEFKGVKLVLSYEMVNSAGTKVCEGDSVHCFTDKDGKIVRLAKHLPEFCKAVEAC